MKIRLFLLVGLTANSLLWSAAVTSPIKDIFIRNETPFLMYVVKYGVNGGAFPVRLSRGEIIEFAADPGKPLIFYKSVEMRPYKVTWMPQFRDEIIISSVGRQFNVSLSRRAGPTEFPTLERLPLSALTNVLREEN